ncbi:hypothetical protein ISS85_03475 [Candidatus Microgenomates bacterium]|nr:hypothetical protein [Candidatus Microgenomates bacterium]
MNKRVFFLSIFALCVIVRGVVYSRLLNKSISNPKNIVPTQENHGGLINELHPPCKDQ